MLYIIHMSLSLYKNTIWIRFFFPFTQVNSLFVHNFHTIYLMHMLFIFYLFYILHIIHIYIIQTELELR